MPIHPTRSRLTALQKYVSELLNWSTKAHRYDPDLNPTCYNFALHCGFGIVPARPRKACDKAVVENAVQLV